MVFLIIVAILHYLDIRNLLEVIRELREFNKAKWKDVGRELGLGEEDLDTIGDKNKAQGNKECMVEMLKHWLKRNYDTDKYGLPTWNSLADAVEKSGDSALADTIRKNHL